MGQSTPIFPALELAENMKLFTGICCRPMPRGAELHQQHHQVLTTQEPASTGLKLWLGVPGAPDAPGLKQPFALGFWVSLHDFLSFVFFWGGRCFKNESHACTQPRSQATFRKMVCSFPQFLPQQLLEKRTSWAGTRA